MHRDFEQWISRYSGGKRESDVENGSPPVPTIELKDEEQLLEFRRSVDEEAIFNVVETVHDGRWVWLIGTGGKV